MCSLAVLICNVAACCFGERIRTPSRTATTPCCFGSQVCGVPSVCGRAGARTNVLALVSEAAGALADVEAAGLAEIVPPQIAAGRLLRFGAPCVGLRADKGRRFLDRKADLRIGGPVDMAALLARTAAGEDVAARTVGEFGRNRRRPFGEIGRNVPSRPRGQAAGNAQRFQETLGDRIGFAAGQPPRARRRNRDTGSTPHRARRTG